MLWILPVCYCGPTFRSTYELLNTPPSFTSHQQKLEDSVNQRPRYTLYTWRSTQLVLWQGGLEHRVFFFEHLSLFCFFAKVKCWRWGSCSQPPSFRGHRTRGGWPPKTKWANEPCRCFAGEDETFLWEEKRHLTCVNNAWCTVLILLVWAGLRAAHKRPWLVLSGVMTRPHYMLMAMVFLCFSLLKVIYQTSVPYDRTSRWVLGDPGPICMSGSN